MINYNGQIQESSQVLIDNNRGFLYGDSVFETLRVIQNKVLFSEDHYFRLMAAMRVFRMEIPMNFTLEYFEEQILKLTQSDKTNSNAFRIRFSVYRKGNGYYLPKTNEIEFIITYTSLENEKYLFSDNFYEVELFKDAYITKQLYSSQKSNNKLIHVAGSIYAHENDYQNCLLLNDEKNVTEALQGNLFLFQNNVLTTPPVEDGCLQGVMRKQILSIASKIDTIQVEEKSISPFDLQKADELFITNVIMGIQPITKYRKKTFKTDLSKQLIELLNTSII